MGLGDDIMATAQARIVKRTLGVKAAFGKPGKFYWSEIFEGNPDILQKGEEAEALIVDNFPGHRPYLLGVVNNRFIFNPLHKAHPGVLVPCIDEAEFAAGLDLPERFILIEPNIKGTVSGNNKRWPWEYWQEVAWQLRDEHLVQVGPAGTRLLGGVTHIETATFRRACAVLARASLLIATDGGLHHAAAALGVPAVVIWGGYSPPEVLGYDSHTNLGGGWCGSIGDCAHCHAAMEEISPDAVIRAASRHQA